MHFSRAKLELGKCNCGGDLTKKEIIDGVEVDYIFENGEWEEVDQNWFGDCKIIYECEKCGELND